MRHVLVMRTSLFSSQEECRGQNSCVRDGGRSLALGEGQDAVGRERSAPEVSSGRPERAQGADTQVSGKEPDPRRRRRRVHELRCEDPPRHHTCLDIVL